MSSRSATVMTSFNYLLLCTHFHGTIKVNITKHNMKFGESLHRKSYPIPIFSPIKEKTENCLAQILNKMEKVIIEMLLHFRVVNPI